jgi:hypothetical protein
LVWSEFKRMNLVPSGTISSSSSFKDEVYTSLVFQRDLHGLDSEPMISLQIVGDESSYRLERVFIGDWSQTCGIDQQGSRRFCETFDQTCGNRQSDRESCGEKPINWNQIQLKIRLHILISPVRSFYLDTVLVNLRRLTQVEAVGRRVISSTCWIQNGFHLKASRFIDILIKHHIDFQIHFMSRKISLWINHIKKSLESLIKSLVLKSSFCCVRIQTFSI